MPTGNEHYIVAIGASAGGLEAIHEFFDNMPQHNSISFVVIQHLSSDYKSLLVELISKHTHMKVFEAEHEMTVHRECVYIIPNNKIMTIGEGKIHLVTKTQQKQPNTAIDSFLFSLAEDQKEKAIAIILSGTGTDGTKGTDAIKAAGGMVMVQDPLSAKFDGMPNSAIAAGNADFILPPEMMPDELFGFIKETPIHTLNKGKIDEAQIADIFSMVQRVSGFDFQLYKTPTIIRRIGRRMMQGNFKKLEDYVEHLHNNSAEVKLLSDDFLINVTRFFRDEAAFKVLQEQVIPEIVRQKKDGEVFKIWVTACSSGQEAYSIAIMIDEFLQKRNRHLDVKIFATDIDDKSIETAAKNQYPETIKLDVPKNILEKYFLFEGGQYSVIPRIRKQIVFAKHNIIKDPPFIKNDLVSCRNMLIYMNSILQKKILATFHFSLEQGGYLFLGSSETAAYIKDSVEEISSKWKIYKKTSNKRINAIDLYRPVDKSVVTPKQPAVILKKEEAIDKKIENDFKNLLITDLGYTAIYIDGLYEIRDSVGEFNRYLNLPEKKLHLNLLKMVPQELSVALNTSIRKAWKEHQNVIVKHVKVNYPDGEKYISIIIKPAKPDDGVMYTMVVLNETPIDPKKAEIVTHTAAPDQQQLEYITELEFELAETRNNLQMAIESLETTNEELQSSNEELLSANEELQSSNEELQSLNEELHTLNTEHQFKIKELIELNDDLTNHFRSIDIGQVFLDRSLHIRKFNPAATKLINLIESDMGRPISDISNNLLNENIVQNVKQVMDNNEPIEKEMSVDGGKHYLVKFVPYIRQDSTVDGVVITFVDISTINYLNNVIKGVFNSTSSAVMVFKAVRNRQQKITDFECVTANQTASKSFENNKTEFAGAKLKELLNNSKARNLFDDYVATVETGETLNTELEVEPDGKITWYEVVAVKMLDGFVVTFTDITNRKLAEETLKKNNRELTTARENLNSLNADLEHKVEERTKELSESEERFRFVSNATNDAIWDWNMIDNNVWWNDNFFRMFGYETDKHVQERSFWQEKIHQQDQKKVQNSINEAINGKARQWVCEYRFKRADGSYAYVLDRGYLIRDKGEKTYRMIGSMMDVSKLVLANKEIQKNEARFRFLADAIPQKVFTAFPDGNVNYYNQQWPLYSGEPMEELNNLGWKKLLHADEQEEVMNAWQHALTSGEELETEHRLRRYDGEYRWHLNRAVPLRDSDNEIVLWVGTTTDIHDQKEFAQQLQESENHFRELADQSPFMIWQVDGEGLCEYVNRTWVDFTGLDTEKSKGLGWGNAIHDEDSQSEYAKFMRCFKKRVPYHSKFRIKRHDGEYRWVRAQANPVSNSSGYIGSLNDITEQEMAEQATKTLLQQKDEFLSIASHELKTPITSMKASLQLAERITSNSTDGLHEVNSFILRANKQVNKLSGLVEDLLDVTKIHSGKIQFNKMPFPINDAIQECIEQVQSDNIKHKIIIKGAVKTIVYADRHRLEQVINNFISNGIKYSPDGKELVIEVVADKKNMRLSVTDHGIGIPTDKLPFVFDRFFRVQEQSHKFSGLGLGLFISAEIIKRHGGEIGVFSNEEKGSTFWFNIPIHGEKKEMGYEDEVNKEAIAN
jgi:two-component system CheB/CheR fusion protein